MHHFKMEARRELASTASEFVLSYNFTFSNIFARICKKLFCYRLLVKYFKQSQVSLKRTTKQLHKQHIRNPEYTLKHFITERHFGQDDSSNKTWTKLGLASMHFINFITVLCTVIN